MTTKNAARAAEKGCTCPCHTVTRRKILREVAGLLEGVTYAESMKDGATQAEMNLLHEVERVQRQVEQRS